MNFGPEPPLAVHGASTIGKERYENSKAKSLLYGDDDPNRSKTPVKTGKRAHLKEAQQAPFATFSTAELDTITHEDKNTVDSATKKLREKHETGKVGVDGFDPQVYKNAIAANALTKRERSLRNFNGSGNILSHSQGSDAAQ